VNKSTELTVNVNEEFRQVVEFWDQLFDIIGVFHQGAPAAGDGVELTIRHIKPVNNKILWYSNYPSQAQTLQSPTKTRHSTIMNVEIEQPLQVNIHTHH
jgi:hypothetical protein